METRNIVDVALRAREDAAIATVALQGAVEPELKRIADARAALAAEEGAVVDAKLAEKLKGEAETYRATAKEALRQATLDAEQMKSQAHNTLQEAETIKLDLQAKAGELEKAITEWNDLKATVAESQSARDADLDAREDAVRRHEGELAAALSKLATDRAALNARLEALKI